MKKVAILFFVSCSLLLALGIFYQFGDLEPKRSAYSPSGEDLVWQTLKLSDDGLQLQFPTPPLLLSTVIYDQISQKTRDYDVYASESLNGDTFVLTIIKFLNTSPQQVEANVDQIVKEFVNRKSENTLDFLSEAQEGEGMNFKINNQGDRQTFGYIFPRGNKMFVLTLVTAHNDEASFERFKESLTKLTGDEDEDA